MSDRGDLVRDIAKGFRDDVAAKRHLTTEAAIVATGFVMLKGLSYLIDAIDASGEKSNKSDFTAEQE